MTMRNWKEIIGYGLAGVLFGAALALGLEATFYLEDFEAGISLNRV
ncbi:hypothetical protein [Cupriavidus oxalaticus]|uniref:Uncharacterized protein n=1 Tax=Cupriavidus oxalaticus TaxID=96344 RepID=A0A375FSR0_9BURK|nr:hypothetical protein [Cupriavidus oxalaticus]QRQ93509.1 hypothetical protein JTE92_25930 [Cupriavidus oxalaticus]SPC08567.1 exported hypothetical protein [Cupriavidus oxalaticus]